MASTPDKKDTFSNQIKPRPIGRNFPGHQLPTFLDVTCMSRPFAHPVARCCEKFETSQTF